MTLYQRSKTFKSVSRQSGFGLLEVVLSLLVVAILGIVAYNQYNDSRTEQRIQQEAGNIQRIAAKIQEKYNGAQNFTGVTLAGLIGNSIFPANMVNGANVRNSYNGAVTVAIASLGGAGANDAVNITEAALPTDACTGLITKSAGAMARVDVGAVTVKPYQGVLDVNAVGVECAKSATANTVSFYVMK